MASEIFETVDAYEPPDVEPMGLAGEITFGSVLGSSPDLSGFPADLPHRIS